MTHQNQSSPVQSGLNARQWALLLVSFVLGIAACLAVDKVFLTNQSSTGTVQAAAPLQ